MKGPFERLKYDLRRVWECPECHHRERADGTVTTLICRCQATKDSLDRVVMKLVEDRIQRRLPLFVPPTDAEEPEGVVISIIPPEPGGPQIIPPEPGGPHSPTDGKEAEVAVSDASPEEAKLSEEAVAGESPSE